MAASGTVKDVLFLEVLATRDCQGQCRDDQSSLQDLASVLATLSQITCIAWHHYFDRSVSQSIHPIDT
jgi:hypothetical protein